MAFLPETFDINELPVGNAGNFEPLPAGWYTCTISQAELKATKAGDGQYIKLRYDITGPTHQGRVVFGNLNIKNANAKAEEIGRQHLGEIMRAIGLAKVTDTDQLIGGQIAIKLGIKPDKGFGASNDAKGFKSVSGSVAPSASAVPAAAAPAATGKAAPPWAKK
tara:strand:+ start:695 stop:1186 length:492 start_codon:yes stop_codon:yes gene_type:complete